MTMSHSLYESIQHALEALGGVHMSNCPDLVSWIYVRDQSGSRVCVVPTSTKCKYNLSYDANGKEEYLKEGDCFQASSNYYSSAAYNNHKLLKASYLFAHNRRNEYADYSIERYCGMLEKALCKVRSTKIRLWYGGDPVLWEHLAGVYLLAKRVKKQQYLIMTANVPIVNSFYAWMVARGESTLPTNFKLLVEENRSKVVLVAPIPVVKFVRGSNISDLHTWPTHDTPNKRDIGDLEARLYCERHDM